MGLPVVAADQVSVREFADQIAIAHSPDEWIAEIEKALAGNGIGTPETRQARARQNDWTARVDLFEGWLQEMIADKPGRS